MEFNHAYLATNKNNTISQRWFIHLHVCVLDCSSMLGGFYIPGHLCTYTDIKAAAKVDILYFFTC